MVDYVCDDEYKVFVKLCLVGFLFDEKVYDQGIVLVFGDVVLVFVGLYVDCCGDFLVVQNKNEDVCVVYKLVLEKFGLVDVLVCQIVQFKLDVLGGV